jgi:hypothetical protein
VGDQVLFSPEDQHEVEVHGEEMVILRERDVHAVAASGSRSPPASTSEARPAPREHGAGTRRGPPGGQERHRGAVGRRLGPGAASREYR